MLSGINASYIQVQVFVDVDYLGKLVFAQQTIVHKNAVEVGTNGLADENSGHRTVDPATESHHHLIVAQLRLEGCHGTFYETFGRPIGCAAANIDEEIADEGFAVGAVRYFGVKLDAINRFIGKAEGRIGNC